MMNQLEKELESSERYKVCSKCKQKKPVNEFSKYKRSKDGLQHYCKDCKNKYYQAHKEEIKKYNKKYRQTHQEELKQYKKKYRQQHQDEIKQWRKNRYKQHRQEENQRSIEWRMQHQLSRARNHARQRGLDFNLIPPPDDFLNDDWFSFKLVFHHLDDDNVVLIPEPLHKQYSGLSTEQHRAKLLPIIKEHYTNL